MKCAMLLIWTGGLLIGASVQRMLDHSPITVAYHEQSNGDYRLTLTGADRKLVCEEKDIQITQQGDAINPVVIECRH